MMFQNMGYFWTIFVPARVLFTVLTLAVELDASRRALVMLDETGLRQSQEDRSGSKAVLRAAALTYVAAAITSVLQLLYYVSIAQRRRWNRLGCTRPGRS